MSPAKNSVFLMPLISELTLASSMASGHIFDADDLARLSGHEVGDGSCAGIKVVNQLVAGEPCEVAGHFVQKCMPARSWSGRTTWDPP